MPGMVMPTATTAVNSMDPHLLACQVGSWYSLFANQALRSVVLDLTDEFITYLDADGVFVPEKSEAMPQPKKVGQHYDEDEYQDWEDGSSNADDSEEAQDWTELCPSLLQMITAAVAELGGIVVPKMNWSCPSDATWLSPFNNMQCSSADQVVLLLKSSDRVSHDLSTMAAMPESCRPRAQLALRKWYDLRPEREFRCFIRQHSLVGISQRDPTQFFPQLQGDMPSFSRLIKPFITQKVLPVFPLANYTCDVYVATTGSVKIVDFNPIGGTTAPLLFDWEELYSPEELPAAAQEQQASPGADSISSSAPAASADAEAGQEAAEVIVRIIEDASKLQAGQRTAVAMPYDMLGLANAVDDIMQQMQRAEQL